MTSSRKSSLARTQSVPGRIMLDEALAGTSGGSSGQASSSSAAGRPWLHRATGSGGGSSGGPSSGLRRTSSSGLPPLSGGGSVGGTRASSSGVHRLSASGLRRTTSLEASPAGSRHATPERQGRPGSGASSEACTPEGQLPFGMPYDDSAGGMHAGAGKAAWRSGGSSSSRADSPLSPVDLQHPLLYSEPSTARGSGTGGGSTAPSSLPSPAESSGAASSSGGSGLARQSSFSQPYFAEFEEPSPAAAGPLSPEASLSPSAGASTPPNAAPAVPSPEGSGSARAAQLAAAQEQMTAEELHQVRPDGGKCARRCSCGQKFGRHRHVRGTTMRSKIHPASHGHSP